MAINPTSSSNVFYIGKKAGLGPQSTVLVVKALGNKSPEKIDQLIRANRFIKVENKNDLLTIKANSVIAELLATKEFTCLEIRHVSGEKEVIHSKINIQTLSAGEAQELNQAVAKFLASVVIARQEQVRDEGEIKTEESSKEGSKVSVGQDRVVGKKGQLKPSDYLSEAALVSFKGRRGRYVESLKDEAARAKEQNKKDDEKRADLKRAIIKKDIERFDNEHKRQSGKS